MSFNLHANSTPEGPPPTTNNFCIDELLFNIFKIEFNF